METTRSLGKGFHTSQDLRAWFEWGDCGDQILVDLTTRVPQVRGQPPENFGKFFLLLNGFGV